MKKIFIITTVFFALLVGGFFALNHYIYQQKQIPNPPPSPNLENKRGSLSGEYVCLPHVDTEGPQTMECAFGLKTDEGEYYAVDLHLMSQPDPQLQIGDHFTANGLIVPIEEISSDHWRKYPIKGIFSITDSVQKL